jgi:hypothetical protein
LFRLRQYQNHIQIMQHANGDIYGNYNAFKFQVQLTNNFQFKLLNTQFNNVLLENVTNGEVNRLDQLLAPVSSKIVFYFSPTQCHKCIDKEVPNIKAFADSIGGNNIIAIASETNQEFLRRFSLIKKINIPFYLIRQPNELNKDIYDSDVPYAFLIDKNRRILKACSLSSSLDNWSTGFYQSFKKGSNL